MTTNEYRLGGNDRCFLWETLFYWIGLKMGQCPPHVRHFTEYGMRSYIRLQRDFLLGKADPNDIHCIEQEAPRQKPAVAPVFNEYEWRERLSHMAEEEILREREEIQERRIRELEKDNFRREVKELCKEAICELQLVYPKSPKLVGWTYHLS